MDQINEVLRATLAMVIERDVEFPTGVILTVKRIITSKDLSTAKVWTSVLPAERTKEVLIQLRSALPDLQRQVAALVELQFMPTFRLIVDASEERAQHITDILDELADKRAHNH